MLIRIIESNKGCVFKPGQIVRIGDKQAKNLVDKGLAVVLEQWENPPRRRSVVCHNRSRAPAPKMMPPRNICPCGMVFKTDTDLAAHKEVCA